ncbi:head maturation protease, ClpP-related [Paraliobacillus sp. JSM ZJ581]|uniref:head maturation protease, ClpP-related n=1 Tax=Paraliobacillus sp. JSM ZJ581 TaxID=3342118 RepID=UPI0035A858E8
MKKFWNWIKNEDTNKRSLHLYGAIAEESWFDDEVTPAEFREELMQGSGDIEVWINSPGGDCIAAAQIYNMLMEYPSDVLVKIDGIAASAASVIAMAGTEVQMSPTSLMMIHNPFTIAIGDSEEMKKTVHMLDEVKESIINAYEIKTSLSRQKLSNLMDAETWLNAHKAIELGFADTLMFVNENQDSPVENSFVFSRKAVTNSLLNKMKKPQIKQSVEPLYERLNLLKY